jgi:hypothetical protein
MAITKNHTQYSSTSKMYDAIKNDNVILIQEVEAAGGDIYDIKGNGKFFQRALSSHSMNVISFYLNDPDIKAKIKQSKSTDFFYALKYANLDTLKIMSKIGMDINVEEILDSVSTVISQEFLLKTKLFLLMSDAKYYAELSERRRSVSETDIFHSALVTRNYELFLFAYTFKEEFGLEVPHSAIKYVLDRFNFAYEKDKGDDDSHKALELSDQLLSVTVREFEKHKASARLDTKLNIKITNIISTMTLSLNDICRKPITLESGSRAKFVIDIITEHKDSALTKAIMPYLKAELLGNRHINSEFLIKHKAALITSEPLIINLSQDSLKRLLTKPDAPTEFDKEAFELGQDFLKRTLSESGIDMSNIRECIQSSAKESLVIKQAIMSYAIRKYGIGEALSPVKHISYLKALYEIGYNPFDIIPYITNAKLLTRLMEDLSKN